MAICRRGSDFLSFDNILVDVRHRRLFDITTFTVNGDPVGTSGGQINVLAGSSRYHTTLLDFPEIIHPAGVPQEPRHSTPHPDNAWTTRCFESPAASTGSPQDR